ncbi:MAG: hypothetical protein J4F45_12750, partial [Pseudomonadales bacterium]|nr:hypothetical protein [Pseudomonadales bacterium]
MPLDGGGGGGGIDDGGVFGVDHGRGGLVAVHRPADGDRGAGFGVQGLQGYSRERRAVALEPARGEAVRHDAADAGG